MLSAAELVALRQSGFVTAETRGRNRLIFRLRGRLDGRQFTLCLGSDAQRAQAVREALSAWQAGRCAEKRIRLLAQQSQALLRSVKPHLAPYVAAAGFKFHGLRIRKPRSKTASAAAPI